MSMNAPADPVSGNQTCRSLGCARFLDTLTATEACGASKLASEQAKLQARDLYGPI